jgi:hypothetical protein
MRREKIWGIGVPDREGWPFAVWVFAWVYWVGYCVYLFVVGWASWPKMAWGEWLTHVSYESVYALAWPILIVLSALGYR